MVKAGSPFIHIIGKEKNKEFIIYEQDEQNELYYS